MKTKRTRQYRWIMYATTHTAAVILLYILDLYYPWMPVFDATDTYPIAVYVFGFGMLWALAYGVQAGYYRLEQWLDEPEAKTAEDLDSGEST